MSVRLLRRQDGFAPVRGCPACASGSPSDAFVRVALADEARRLDVRPGDLLPTLRATFHLARRDPLAAHIAAVAIRLVETGAFSDDAVNASCQPISAEMVDA